MASQPFRVPNRILDRGDPLNTFAQNVIKDDHRDLEAQFPQLSRSPVFEPAYFYTQSATKLITVPKGGPKVGIIGGGIGGLYAAKLLQDCGVPYEILEASPRLGGRLFTHRMGDRPNDYYDIGAMRFPDTPIMGPLFDLFREISLPLGDYRFKDERGNSVLLYNDINKQRIDGPVKPNDFQITGVTSKWGDLGWQKNVSNVVDPFANALVKDFQNNTKDGWKLMMKYDMYSMKAYMTGNRSDTACYLDREKLMPYPIEVVNWCETFDKSTGWYDRGLTETVLESLAFQYDRSPINWKYIVGGSSELAKTLDQHMAKKAGYTRPFFNARVTGISCVSVDAIPTTISPTGKTVPLQAVPTARIDLESGCDNIPTNGCIAVQLTGGRTRFYSHVITTTTLPCLRTMDLRGAKLDYQQKEALRMLQYGPSTKIGVRFRRRWWEDDTWMKASGAYGAILGGQSYTDNMSRTVVYPSYGIGDDLSGAVVIVSYAWTNDALALSSLMGCESQATLKQRVLQDLVEVHNFNSAAARELEEEWEDVHAFSWSNDPMTMGAFAFFGPGDFKKLYPALTRPAGGGRLHFAGEVSSVRHAWVVGALEASARVVHEILCESYPEKVAGFEQKYGFAEGWTRESLLKQVAITLEGAIGEFPPGQ